MGWRSDGPADPMLYGYDPVRDLPEDHLARLVEEVVNEALGPLPPKPIAPGRPQFDPRLCVKVLIYAYATGVRSSRQMERLCTESLPFLLLCRGDAPSYRVLCSTRVNDAHLLEQAWVALFAVAQRLGMERVGRVVMDSTKMRANASPEMTVGDDEYEAIKAQLGRALAEAEAIDAREERQGGPPAVLTGKVIVRDQMRDIVRRVRKRLGRDKKGSPSQAEPEVAPGECEPAPVASHSEQDLPQAEQPEPAPAQPVESMREHRLSPQMLKRIREAVAAIEAAQFEGRAQVCLTDPDARMMAGGRDGRIRFCHSLEAVVDKACGLLVAGGVTQEASDNARLKPLLELAQAHEPGGVVGADADSGYFASGPVRQLLEAGLDLCVPDSNMAYCLHRDLPVGTGQRPLLSYEVEADVWRCVEGNTLTLRRIRQYKGEPIRCYRAQQACRGCVRIPECFGKENPKARCKEIAVREQEEQLHEYRERFNDEEMRSRYRHRAGWVEGVFGFLRGALGYSRWLLRGDERVECEGKLMQLAYQIRRVHGRWAGAIAG